MKEVLTAVVLAVAGLVVLPASLAAQGFASDVVVAGDEVLVSESRAGGSDGGVVYIYSRSGDGWVRNRQADASPTLGGERIRFRPCGGRGPAPGVGAEPTTAGECERPRVRLRTSAGWSDGRRDRRPGAIGGDATGHVDGRRWRCSGDRRGVTRGRRRRADLPQRWWRMGAGSARRGSWKRRALRVRGPPWRFRTGGVVVGNPVADSLAGAAYVYENGPDGWSMTAEADDRRRDPAPISAWRPMRRRIASS